MIKNLQKIKEYLSEQYGKLNEKDFSYEDFENISHFYKYKMEQEGESSFIDDITWNDVNMDNVFLNINNTNSSVGQEYLYYLLRKADSSEDELKERDKVIEHFSENEESRNEIGSRIYKMGYARKISLSDYINNITKAPITNNIKHYLSMLSFLVSLVITLFFDAGLGVGVLFVSACYSVIQYYSDKAKVEPYFCCITYVNKMVGCGKQIVKYNDKSLSKYNDILKKNLSILEPELKGAWIIGDSNSVDGSLGGVFLDYMRMLTHSDLIKFNKLVKVLDNHKKEIFELYETLGFMESMIGIASYRTMLPYYSKPVFGKEKKLKLIEGYHPLVAEPVCNSIETDKSAIITGSNASGKSTFLKAIAINAILSQSIFTCVAKEYEASRFRVYSSIALSDNIQGGESYYMVEIKSLKRIYEASCTDGVPVLCFVDEVLRGTNTVERIAASSQILKNLSQNNALCFAATHDIELTSILSKYYRNYHFRESVIDNDVHFNYTLYDGPATTRNAIKLLGIIGYDSDIIKASDELAQNFVATGEWRVMS